MTLKTYMDMEPGIGGVYEAIVGTGSYNASSPIGELRDVLINPTTTGFGYLSVGSSGFAADTWISYAVNPSQTDSYISIRVKVNTLPSATEILARFLSTDGGQHKAYLLLHSDGKLTIRDANGADYGPSAAAMSAGNTYKVDVKIPTGTAIGLVRLNGSEIINTGSGAWWSGANGMSMYWGKTADLNGSGYSVQFDNYILDDTAFVQSGYAIAHHLPIGVGSVGDWLSTAGGAATAADVNDLPWDLLRSSRSNGNDTAQLFTIESCATKSVSGTILGVMVIWRMSQDNSAACTAKPRVKSGATTVEPSTGSDPGAATRYQYLMTVDPNTGVAWTTSAIDALEVGAVEGAASAARVLLSSVGVSVAYVAGGAASAVPIIEHYHRQMGA